ncbi:hypothetical protein [Pedobacter sp. NJ-S-72]
MEGLKDQLKKAKNNHSDNTMTKNNDPLYDKNSKTDHGSGQRDDNEDEKQKIIRT